MRRQALVRVLVHVVLVLNLVPVPVLVLPSSVMMTQMRLTVGDTRTRGQFILVCATASAGLVLLNVVPRSLSRSNLDLLEYRYTVDLLAI